MLASERLAEIEGAYGELVQRIVPLALDGQMVRLILYLRDGTNLRVTEQWDGELLIRYSYYWLTSENELKVGWDNAPHHTQVDTYPDHKHVERQQNLQPSTETSLQAVLDIILDNDHSA